jgi:hypothetical protein
VAQGADGKKDYLWIVFNPSSPHKACLWIAPNLPVTAGSFKSNSDVFLRHAKPLLVEEGFPSGQYINVSSLKEFVYSVLTGTLNAKNLFINMLERQLLEQKRFGTTDKEKGTVAVMMPLDPGNSIELSSIIQELFDKANVENSKSTWLRAASSEQCPLPGNVIRPKNDRR